MLALFYFFWEGRGGEEVERRNQYYPVHNSARPSHQQGFDPKTVYVSTPVRHLNRCFSLPRSVPFSEPLISHLHTYYSAFPRHYRPPSSSSANVSITIVNFPPTATTTTTIGSPLRSFLAPRSQQRALPAQERRRLPRRPQPVTISSQEVRGCQEVLVFVCRRIVFQKARAKVRKGFFFFFFFPCDLAPSAAPPHVLL